MMVDLFPKLSKQYIIVICSGRGLTRIYRVLGKYLDFLNIPIIADGGASLILGGEHIYQYTIPLYQKKKIVDSYFGNQLESTQWINFNLKGQKGYYFWFNKRTNDIEDNDIIILNFNEFCEKIINNEIIKITLKTNDNKKIYISKDFVKGDVGIYNCISNKTNKLKAINKILKVLRINISECLYFGNDENDYCAFKCKKLDCIYVYEKKVIDKTLAKEAVGLVEYNKLKEYLKLFL